MHIPRIYLSQSLTENSTVELEPAAAHHLAKVLRMKSGQSVILFNGLPVVDHSGVDCFGEYEATLAYVDKKNVCVAVGAFKQRQTESPLAIELGICLIKNDRMDWLLQKATELGVSSISPLWSDHTDIKIPVDRLEKKQHHWRQVVVSASEQSQRVKIPTINPPQKIQQWCDNVDADKKIVLHPYEVTGQNNNASSPSSVALLVGPEGGLSDSEVELACHHGFQSLQLGNRILRAETAPLAAITLCQYQLGDFSEGIKS